METLLPLFDKLIDFFSKPPGWFTLFIISVAVEKVLVVVAKDYIPAIAKTSSKITIIEIIMTICLFVITLHEFLDKGAKSHVDTHGGDDNKLIFLLIIFILACFISMIFLYITSLTEKIILDKSD